MSRGSIVQRVLLGAFGPIQRSGILRLPAVQVAYQRVYFVYKRMLEDPFWGLIRRYPSWFGGGHILDVGANIGYTASLFAQVVSPGYRVFAFEPEPWNFRLLQKAAERLSPAIVPVASAVGEGLADWALLQVSPNSHAGHSLADGAGAVSAKTIRVPIQSLDAFLKSVPGPAPVSFIKIDVQGAELQVCRGMRRLLLGNERVTVACEVDPHELQAQRCPAQSLIDFFVQEHRMRAYRIHARGRLTPLPDGPVSRWMPEGTYGDVLFRRRPLDE